MSNSDIHDSSMEAMHEAFETFMFEGYDPRRQLVAPESEDMERTADGYRYASIDLAWRAFLSGAKYARLANNQP